MIAVSVLVLVIVAISVSIAVCVADLMDAHNRREYDRSHRVSYKELERLNRDHPEGS